MAVEFVRLSVLVVAMLISVVLLVGYAFILLALFAGGSHFRRRYPAQR